MEKYYLMHKDNPVAKVLMNLGRIVSLEEIYDKKRMPVSTQFLSNTVYIQRQLENWRRSRCIPRNRQNVDNIVSKIGFIDDLALKNMEVSLTDCYWFKKQDYNLTWKDVNYHDNGFSSDVSELILTEICTAGANDIDIKTPDFVTDGMLKKTWISVNNIPTLVKFGDLGIYSEGRNLLSANEVIISQIAQEMNIPHAQYFPLRIQKTGEMVCGTPCIVQDNTTELIPAGMFANINDVVSRMELYNLFAKFGMKNEIDRMIQFDFFIRNTDRHTGNFGVLRDADTLHIVGFAPLYDNGSCLFWNTDKYPDNIPCKPFCENWDKQLSLTGSSPKLPDINNIYHIITDNYQLFGISKARTEFVMRGIEQTARKLRVFQKEMDFRQEDICR